jgi:hypothetical protein
MSRLSLNLTLKKNHTSHFFSHFVPLLISSLILSNKEMVARKQQNNLLVANLFTEASDDELYEKAKQDEVELALNKERAKISLLKSRQKSTPLTKKSIKMALVNDENARPGNDSSVFDFTPESAKKKPVKRLNTNNAKPKKHSKSRKEALKDIEAEKFDEEMKRLAKEYEEISKYELIVE